MEKKIRERLMMQQTCQEQMAVREMREQAKRDEEEAFRKAMMDKFAEDDRIEQMNAQKRRMRQLEHKREADRLLEEKRRQHAFIMVTNLFFIHFECHIGGRTQNSTINTSGQKRGVNK